MSRISLSEAAERAFGTCVHRKRHHQCGSTRNPACPLIVAYGICVIIA
jgi:hypothetical protein